MDPLWERGPGDQGGAERDSRVAGISTGWTLCPSAEKGQRPDGRELVGTRGSQVPERKGSEEAGGARGFSGLWESSLNWVS